MAVLIFLLGAILWFYIIKFFRERAAFSKPEPLPRVLRMDGVYVFQYKGPNKLRTQNCELTQMIVFIDEKDVFMEEVDEIVEIEGAEVASAIRDIRNREGLNKENIGSYTRDRNLIRMEFNPGNFTSYYLAGALTEYGLLIDIDTESINWEKGGSERINVFQGAKYKFVHI